MANYVFETITPDQAAAFQPGDSLTFSTGSAGLLRVAFLSPNQTAITMSGLTVDFGPGIIGTYSGLPDGGVLYVGTPGPDTATAGAMGGSALFGGAGDDLLNGGAGADLLQGNQGADTLNGGGGNNTLFGGQGNDLITMGAGTTDHNFVNGNVGDDTIIGSNGGDILLGGQGNDLITGGAGPNLLFGNLGNDTIHGGAGDDTINGGPGYDVMSGGGGANVFVFAPGDSVIDFQQADRILDWKPTDHIQLPVHGGFMEVQPSAPAPMPPSPYMGGYAPVDDFSAGESAANSAFAANAALTTVATQGGSDVDVWVDTNGDHVADMVIVLANTTLSSVAAGNFI
jgi:Ca2+-binding RTX toxin-like protein